MEEHSEHLAVRVPGAPVFCQDFRIRSNMVVRDKIGNSLIIDEDADTGAPFSAEEQQDIEEELQVEITVSEAQLSLLAGRKMRT